MALFPRIRTTAQVKDSANYYGSTFFSADAVRFFGSRLSSHIRPTGDQSGYFVTSERDPMGEAHGGRRTYTVRSYSLDGDRFNIDTVDSAYALPTMRDAVKAMHAL